MKKKMTVKEEVLSLIKEFTMEVKRWHRDEHFFADVNSLIEGLKDDVKKIEIKEFIRANSIAGKCNRALFSYTGNMSDDLDKYDFYEGYEDEEDKSGCGAHGNGMPCICDKPKNHRGAHVCGECGEEWERKKVVR